MIKSTPLIWLIVFSTFLSTAYAQKGQHQYKDSLLKVIQPGKRDTNTINALRQLYRLYFNEGDFSSSLLYCQDALRLSAELGLKDKLPRIIYSIGLNYVQLAQYDSARYYLDRSIKLPEAATDTILMVQYNNSNAILCNYQSDHSTAITYLMKSVDLLEAASNPDIRVLIAQTYRDLCTNFLAENQPRKSIEYGIRALACTNYPEETRYRILAHLDLSDAYMQLNKAKEAGRHMDTAIRLRQHLNNTAITIRVANSKGAYYEYINDLPAALTAFREAYQLADSIKSNLLKSRPANNIAIILYKMEDYKGAEQYAHIAIAAVLKTGQFVVTADAYKLLTQIAEKKGDYKNALRYSLLNKRYADSATNSATQKVTLSLESKYQHQKKEKEIAELKAGSAEKELLIVKRNRLIMIGGLSATVLLLSIGWLYWNSKQKQTIAAKEQHLQQEHIKFLERQQQVISLQSMLNGQETERTRIAKDLHDGLGGLFSTVKMNFSVLQHEHPFLKESPLFQKSYELVDTASGELRRVAHNMMPEVLMKLGLIQAAQDMCASISSGKLLRVTLQAYGMNKRLNPSSEIMLYRILQELINNIIKHAQATEAIIQFNKNSTRLTVTVEDNGKGFNMQDVDTARHSGMESVKNRVHYLNGNINIDSQKGIGTTVLMEFLINEEDLSLS